MAWIFLIIAAACETAWTFSLKLMKFSELKKLSLETLVQPSVSLPVLLPFVGYIVFGLVNIYFFSLAVKQMPMAIAFAVWTAVTLIFIKLTEVLFLKQSVSGPEVFFMLMIMGGIIGLKSYVTMQ
jgi:quaternary ammonium compound-resistance protein SugE